MGNKQTSFSISVNLPVASAGTGQKVRRLKVEPTDTILSVKQKLQDLIPLAQQRIYDSSPALLGDDAHTLAHSLS